MKLSRLALALSLASAAVFAPQIASAQDSLQSLKHFSFPQNKTRDYSPLFIRPNTLSLQATPEPSAAPAATPQASPGPGAPATAPPVDITSLVKHSNPNFNPCGGWRQMLVSYAAATNCVLDAGEVIVGVNYAATWIPLGTQLVINQTSFPSFTSAVTHAFPSTPLGVGIGGRWQFSYTPPEYQELIGANHNIDKAGTTNQVFSFRNMWYFNRCFTYCGGDALSAVLLTYEAPTGSPAWRGLGPTYTVAFSSTIAVQKSPSGKGRILLNLYDPVTYSAVSSTAGHNTYGFSSTLLTTMIWIHHSWRLNTSIGYAIPSHQWVWNLNPNYLISRRLVIGANYGGAAVALNNQTGVPPSYLAITNTTHPRFLDFSIYYLIGHTIPLIKGIPATDAPGD